MAAWGLPADEEAGLLGGDKDVYAGQFAEQSMRLGFIRKVFGECVGAQPVMRAGSCR
jgi:hypothetical protein